MSLPCDCGCGGKQGCRMCLLLAKHAEMMATPASAKPRPPSAVARQERKSAGMGMKRAAGAASAPPALPSPDVTRASAPTMITCPTCPNKARFKVSPSMRVEDLVKLIDGPVPEEAWPRGWEMWPVAEEAHRLLFARQVAVLSNTIASPLPRGVGRGIVTCAGGKYFVSAWVLLSVLRRTGCQLPIEVWHLGEADLSAGQRAILATVGDVVFRDGTTITPVPRILTGWELKILALCHSGFAEVLLLDADNIPQADPTYLFEDADYQSTGAVLWPDLKPRGWDVTETAWRVAGLPVPGRTERPGHANPTDYRPVESGQVLVDRERRWKELLAALWLGEHRDYFYRAPLGVNQALFWGDKSALALAFMRLGGHYVMPPDCGYTGHGGGGGFLQRDFAGDVLFVHRCQPAGKWTLDGANQPSHGIQNWAWCVEALEDLRRRMKTPATVTATAFPLPDVTPAGWVVRDSWDITAWQECNSLNTYRLPDRMDGWVVVDIGAHIGSFTRACLDRGAAAVHAVECDPDNIRALIDNVGGDPAGRVRILPVAAWHDSTPYLFMDRPEGARHSGGGCVTMGRGDMVRAAVPFDDILRGALPGADSRIGLLKLDCEGAEWVLLHGISADLLGRIDRIAGEYHLEALLPERKDDALWGDAAWLSVDTALEWLRHMLTVAGFTVEIVGNPGAAMLGMWYARRV